MDTNADDHRNGEVAFPTDTPLDDDAQRHFIGHVRSAWTMRAGCPRNVREAWTLGVPTSVEPRYPTAPGGVAAGKCIVVTWPGRAHRDLALPVLRHAAVRRGTFSLRSPVRPNPVGLRTVRILSLDARCGTSAIDGTPLLDLKPFLATVDVPPAASEA